MTRKIRLVPGELADFLPIGLPLVFLVKIEDLSQSLQRLVIALGVIKKQSNKGLGLFHLQQQEWLDALRNTFTVVVPFGLFFWLGLPAVALGMGTGALVICLTDLPGSRSQKGFGALVSIPVFLVIAVLTAFTVDHPFWLALVAMLLSFVLVMFAANGQRMGAVGTMGLGIMAFTIGHHPSNPLEYGFYIALGGIWYYLVSLSQAWLFPYHTLKRALAKTKRDTAALMRLRASGYDPEGALSGLNAKNIKLHLRLTADHELVRRLLLGDRFRAGFPDRQSKILLKQSILLIDLFEQVSVVHYDYPGIRKSLAGAGVLTEIKRAIEALAGYLEGAKEEQATYEKLLVGMENTFFKMGQSNPLLLDILTNLKRTGLLVFSLDDVTDLVSELPSRHFGAFLTEDSFSFGKIWAQLHYASPLFRFALRMALVMLLVVGAIGFLPKGSYGYWIPITLIVISRPSFGMTLKRNMERVAGTLLGLVLGWGLLWLGLEAALLLGIAVLSIFVFYGFLLIRYWVSAMAITLAVVLCLSLYQGGQQQILAERLLFTLLGCAVGLLATFVFPVRHALALKLALGQALLANRKYLAVQMEKLGLVEVKLARKQAYLALSVLNEAALWAAKEPRWRRSLRVLKQLELLCFQLNALIAALPLRDGDREEELIEGKTALVLQLLDEGMAFLASLQEGQMLLLRPLERLDGPLGLEHVAGRLKAILSVEG